MSFRSFSITSALSRTSVPGTASRSRRASGLVPGSGGGGGSPALDEPPGSASRGGFVADQEEAVLSAVALEDDELRDDRDDALDAIGSADNLLRRWRKSGRGAQEVADPALGHDHRARRVVEVGRRLAVDPRAVAGEQQDERDRHGHAEDTEQEPRPIAGEVPPGKQHAGAYRSSAGAPAR